MINFFARLRPIGESGMARRLRLVDRDRQLRASPDETFSAFHPRLVDGGRIEAFRREKFKRAVLTLQIDRAHLGDHDAGDLANDAIELLLALAAFSHDLAQPAHDDAERSLARKGSRIITAPHYHYRANHPIC